MGGAAAGVFMGAAVAGRTMTAGTRATAMTLEQLGDDQRKLGELACRVRS